MPLVAQQIRKNNNQDHPAGLCLVHFWLWAPGHNGSSTELHNELPAERPISKSCLPMLLLRSGDTNFSGVNTLAYFCLNERAPATIS